MSIPRSQVHCGRARATACHLISHPALLTPTSRTVGWEKHCHLFSYKAVKKVLTGKKCLCMHALLSRLIYGRKTSWESIWLELRIKKKSAFCHFRYAACHITQQARGERSCGRWSLPPAFDVVTPRLYSSGERLCQSSSPHFPTAVPRALL